MIVYTVSGDLKALKGLETLTRPNQIKQISKFKGKPTILQVLPELESGGVEHTTLEVAAAIAEAGGRSLVMSAGGELVKDLEERGGEHIKIPLLATRNPLGIAANVRRIRRIVKKENVDVVHVRSRAPAWSVYKALKPLDIPLVTTYHAPYNTDIIFKKFYNSVMARGDRVIAISKFVRDHILSQYKEQSWFSEGALRLIHEGIDLNFFNPKNVTMNRMEYLIKQWHVE